MEAQPFHEGWVGLVVAYCSETWDKLLPDADHAVSQLLNKHNVHYPLKKLSNTKHTNLTAVEAPDFEDWAKQLKTSFEGRGSHKSQIRVF